MATALNDTYLSCSDGSFRVAHQGMPISADCDTAARALSIAKRFGLTVGPLAWNGNTGTWVPIEVVCNNEKA